MKNSKMLNKILALFIFAIILSAAGCEKDMSTNGADVVLEKELVSEDCIWIDYNSRSWFDGVDKILYLDDNIYKAMNERVHNGAKVVLIDITGVIFYEGTVADVLDGYTAELNIDAPTMSDGEMNGCILVYQ